MCGCLHKFLLLRTHNFRGNLYAINSFGTSSCEAEALGRVVIGSLQDNLKRLSVKISETFYLLSTIFSDCLDRRLIYFDAIS